MRVTQSKAKHAMRLTRTRVKLLKRLHEIYLAELYGIAFFTYFIEHYGDRLPVWKTLLRIEERTAHHLKVALESMGIPCADYDPASTAKGIREAEKWASMGWEPLIREMVKWIAPYQQKYEMLASSTPAFKSLFRLVADHENAIFDFMLSEKNQKGNSIKYLEGYLTKKR